MERTSLPISLEDILEEIRRLTIKLLDATDELEKENISRPKISTEQAERPSTEQKN
jgi:hypothetical protein